MKKKKKTIPKKGRSKVKVAAPVTKRTSKRSGAKAPVAKKGAKRSAQGTKRKAPSAARTKQQQEGSVNLAQQQTDLNDDVVINAMLSAGERAQDLVKKKTAADFEKDALLVDAFAGCVVVMASASHDVSPTMWNWAGQVPWEYIDRVADWRKHGNRTKETRTELWEFGEALPDLLNALRTLTL